MIGAPTSEPSWHEGLRYLLSLRRLSPRVARFMWRARRHAVRRGDRFSLASATRPAELSALLALARGRHKVVELGTGTAWTAIALALADSERRVITYDPVDPPERGRYLGMVDARVRKRVELRTEADALGPHVGEVVELLFVDSSHDCESVVTAFRAWQGALAPGAIVAFHDYGHPDYPGVREAARQLDLAGHERGGLFVWRAPS